ncbi:endolytic transglycosylase MltG [Oceanispirochaeta crateris]|uniref:Endolytic murein transglycosylase n=1 Tax=Oceanispirochaeta crateris TaxID=2518645 RepID=A0A5C1QHE3_9SPIO|nr:endolytic transglycosylase MltG [Oceanispirochaeta crateris]QEN07553.1 endolytic transglycosylase MltG [Oceanispirochaeta crateris]
MFKKILIILLLILVISTAGITFYIYKSFQPVSDGHDPTEMIQITIPKGESLYSTLDLLQERNLIHDKWLYKVYSRLIHPFSVKSGLYNFSPNLSGLEILRLLEEGKQELVKVTIPEGLTSSEIAIILESKGIVNQEAFLDSLKSKELLNRLGIPGNSAEGYLFPDTYFFQLDFPPEQVLEHMVQTYFNNLEDIFPFYKELSNAKLQEKVILASIVEKEYRVAVEAPLIASVFYNRMKIGMPLQSCATVIYVITEEQGKPHPDRVFFRDLEIQSEFNTYLNKTLPPAPISNPGKTALKAAFNPAQTDYLFFVVKDAAAGTHNFTSTLADHNNARESYIQGFRSK